jgi:hypothetical protein
VLARAAVPAGLWLLYYSAGRPGLVQPGAAWHFPGMKELAAGGASAFGLHHRLLLWLQTCKLSQGALKGLFAKIKEPCFFELPCPSSPIHPPLSDKGPCGMQPGGLYYPASLHACPPARLCACLQYNPPIDNVYSNLHQGVALPYTALCEGTDFVRNHAAPGIDFATMHIW